MGENIKIVVYAGWCPTTFSLGGTKLFALSVPFRWIGRGIRFPWPARTHDLTFLDFCFLVHMNTLVTCEDTKLWQHTENVADFITYLLYYFVYYFYKYLYLCYILFLLFNPIY